MVMKKHTPEQWERINTFIRKAKAEDRVPPSYWAHVECEIELTAWEAFANLQAEFMSINPFVALKYAFTRETPEINTKDMRQCASRALVEVAKLGQVKRGQGIINDLKADVNYVDGCGRTPLYYAIERKRLGMAEMLLKHGAKNLSAYGKKTPLFRACRDGFIPGISLLIKYGADVNQTIFYRDWNKWYLGYQTWQLYPLGWTLANSKNSARVCQMLLDNGADIDREFCPKHTIRKYLDGHWEDLGVDVQRVFSPILNKVIIEKTKDGDIIELPPSDYSVMSPDTQKIAFQQVYASKSGISQNTRV